VPAYFAEARVIPESTGKGNMSSATTGAPIGIPVPPLAADAGPAAHGPAQRFPAYADVLKWLDQRVDVERLRPSREVADALKLERMKALCAALGHPERGFRSVHVAGTKGKGSTCAMTAAALRGCGLTVGLYTSPHLVDLRERVQINERCISEPDLLPIARKVADVADAIEPEHGPATFFELITAIAFVHFAEQAVDIGVIEVGLGGRLDSTNVITPEVSVVTSISWDHWQILGDSLPKIAREKAGIFKPGVIAVAIDQKPEVVETFRQVAAEVGAPLRVVGKEIEYSVRFEASPALGPHMRVSVTGMRHSYEHVAVPLRGEHQAGNCALALAVMDALGERGFRTPEDRVIEGLARTRFPGRMELIKTKPRILLDGAHNADSMKMLMKSIGLQIQSDSMVVIFGCAADKDIDGMLKELATGADKVIFTRTSHARAADPRELARRFTETSGKMCQTAPSFEAAVELAKRAVGREDVICVTGSLYLVGEATRFLRERGLA